MIKPIKDISWEAKYKRISPLNFDTQKPQQNISKSRHGGKTGIHNHTDIQEDYVGL